MKQPKMVSIEKRGIVLIILFLSLLAAYATYDKYQICVMPEKNTVYVYGSKWWGLKKKRVPIIWLEQIPGYDQGTSGWAAYYPDWGWQLAIQETWGEGTRIWIRW